MRLLQNGELSEIVVRDARGARVVAERVERPEGVLYRAGDVGALQWFRLELSDSGWPRIVDVTGSVIEATETRVERWRELDRRLERQDKQRRKLAEPAQVYGEDSPIKPPVVRQLRREVELVPQQIADENGQPSQPYRAIDTLMAMERRGTITKEMQRAGEMFRDTFARAALEPLRSADPGRIPGTAGPRDATMAQYAARDEIWEAIKALGGERSPLGCCAWQVLGMGASLKEWAVREGWNGRPIGEKAASGILTGALGVLAAHYQLTPHGH